MLGRDFFISKENIEYVSDNEEKLIILNKVREKHYTFIPKYLKNDLLFLKEILNINGMLLEQLSDNIKDNYDLVLLAVKNEGASIKYASKKLKYNKEIIKIAVKQNYFAIIHYDNKINNEHYYIQMYTNILLDYEIILISMSHNELAYSNVSYGLTNTEELNINCMGYSSIHHYIKELINSEYGFLILMFRNKILNIDCLKLILNFLPNKLFYFAPFAKKVWEYLISKW